MFHQIKVSLNLGIIEMNRVYWNNVLLDQGMRKLHRVDLIKFSPSWGSSTPKGSSNELWSSLLQGSSLEN